MKQKSLCTNAIRILTCMYAGCASQHINGGRLNLMCLQAHMIQDNPNIRCLVAITCSHTQNLTTLEYIPLLTVNNY